LLIVCVILDNPFYLLANTFSFYLLVILSLYNLNTFCVVILNLYTFTIKLPDYLFTFFFTFSLKVLL